MWDLANGKLLRTITDAHPPGTAVLHVKVHTKLRLAQCVNCMDMFIIPVCVCVCSLQMTQLLQCAMTAEDQCLSWRSGELTFYTTVPFLSVSRSLYDGG